MKWIYEPGEPSRMLVLSQSEVNMLRDILANQARSNINRKYEKYSDLHESGEATDRQCDLMNKYEDQLKFIDGDLYIIHHVKHTLN